MTASPFPEQSNPFQPVAAPVPIKERGSHVPASYVRNPHQEPETIVVKQHDVPLMDANKEQFVVAQVAPERRWAIQNNGELLPQSEFHARMGMVRLEFYAMLRDNGHPNAKFDGNIDIEPVPAVDKYVSWCVDPEDNEHLILIGFNPKAKAGEKPDVLFDSDGEAIDGARIDHLCNAYADRRLRKSLRADEIREVEAHLGLQASDDDHIIAKLEMLTELKMSGDLTDEQYAKKVAALTGKVVVQTEAPAEKPAEPTEKPFKASALCGNVSEGVSARSANFGKQSHERWCEECQGMSQGDHGIEKIETEEADST